MSCSLQGESEIVFIRSQSEHVVLIVGYAFGGLIRDPQECRTEATVTCVPIETWVWKTKYWYRWSSNDITGKNRDIKENWLECKLLWVDQWVRICHKYEASASLFTKCVKRVVDGHGTACLPIGQSVLRMIQWTCIPAIGGQMKRTKKRTWRRRRRPRPLAIHVHLKWRRRRFTLKPRWVSQ